ncbi:MAG: CBS domain-containing protein [Gammaproteobacteria bacterium]|jgi:CBS domain-containing protein
MRVSDVMERDVRTCSPDDSLEAVAMTMWNNDCGAVPIIGQSGEPLGIITDRDIAMSCALNHKPLWELHARDVANNRSLYTSREGDDIQSALNTMQTHRVRRLPVVDDSGHLRGIVSMDDVIYRSEEHMPGMSYWDTMNTLKAVCIHH